MSSNKITISDYYYKKTEIDTMMNGKANTSHTHTASEITDFPVIPDVSNYIRKSSTSGLVKNDGSIDTTSYLSSLPNHTHTTSEITDIISIIAETAEDNAIDVMNKIGMAYFLRNQTVYDVTGTVTNYWQEVTQHGLSAVLLDYIVNEEGVYEVRKNQSGMQTTDLFYYYNGDSKLTLLTPMKVDWSISNYNPNIDSTVTVRARIMDMFDNAISYENVTLNYEAGGVGGSVNLISDSDGYVSYEYTCSSWGQCRFSIKTYSSFIYVDAMSKTDITSALNNKSNTNHTHTWTSQVCTSYGTLYINSAIRICELAYYRKGYNFTSTSEVTLHSNAIPKEYRPKANKYQIGSSFHILGRVGMDGAIYCTSSNTDTHNINLSFVWHY